MDFSIDILPDCFFVHRLPWIIDDDSDGFHLNVIAAKYKCQYLHYGGTTILDA